MNLGSSAIAFTARFDNLYVQLQNTEGATAYVITYRSAEALPGERDLDRMAANGISHLKMRGLDLSRVVFVDGGFRNEAAAELFVSPAGSIPPQPTATVEKPKVSPGTVLWARSGIGAYSDEMDMSLLDEFILPEVVRLREEERRREEMEWALENGEDTAENDGQSIDSDFEPGDAADEADSELTAEEIYNARFSWINDGIASQVAEKEGSRGVIVFYADDQEFDIAKLTEFIKEGRDKIAREADIDFTRIKIVFGGYREFPSAEYYYVPLNGDDPQPKPQERKIVDEGISIS